MAHIASTRANSNLRKSPAQRGEKSRLLTACVTILNTIAGISTAGLVHRLGWHKRSTARRTATDFVPTLPRTSRRRQTACGRRSRNTPITCGHWVGISSAISTATLLCSHLRPPLATRPDGPMRTLSQVQIFREAHFSGYSGSRDT